MTPMPEETGYYWAKWRIASDQSTTEEIDMTPSDDWEIVQVNDNYGEGLERLSVAVFGVTTTQWRDGFVWGEMISPLRGSK